MELSQCAILAQAISLKVALLSRVHLLFWCVCVCIHVNVHGTPWMAGHRGAAGVVQCDPSASSGFGAVATGTELPSASEDAQCVSCVALLLCSSGSITVRKSGPPPTPEEVIECTPSCNTVGVNHAVVGCWRSRVDSSPRSSQEGQSASGHATSCRQGVCFRDVCGREEETFGGS